MEIKKTKIFNSRFFYLPHSGDPGKWSVTLGKLLKKMEEETPYIAANSFVEIFSLSQEDLFVGKEVIGPIRGDLKDIFLEDFPAGEIESLDISTPQMTFTELYHRAFETIENFPHLRDIFSIRINQRVPLENLIQLRFYPRNYEFPKLTI